MAYEGTVGINELAERIEEKCTVHKADVVAIITALIGEITSSLQSSFRVKFQNFGTFKMGLSSRPAETRDKFTVSNIKDVHVLFQPYTKRTAGGLRTRAFVTGSHVQEWKEYDKPDSSDDSSSSTNP